MLWQGRIRVRIPPPPYFQDGGGDPKLHKEGENVAHVHAYTANLILRDWSLITGRGGLQNGKIAGPKLFAPPPRQGKTFRTPPFKEWKLFVPPPPTIWLKLQATT